MKKRVTAAFAAFLCIMSVLGSNMQAKAADIHETELEDYILEEMSAAHIPGMAISIVSGQRERYCAAYGSAQRTEADYVLGSLSKSFTAAAILNMVEDDDLSLDDKVSDYLEGYDAVSDVSIRELLHHTSGIGADETMSGLKGTGTRGEFTYAHANYNLLGEIVEAVSGISYEEYISDNILDPLDMTSTYSLRDSGGIENGLLVGYQNYFGFPFASTYQYDAGDDWMQVPSGYLISDVKDMGKYLQMYLKGGKDVLTPESIDAMLYNGVETSSDMGISQSLFEGSAKYGMGWIEKEVYGEPLLFHSGQTENFMSMMVLLPERDLGIVMLFHSQDALVGQEMVKTLEEGIISIEMDQDAEKIPENIYLIRHGIIDIVLLCIIFLAWMPIFLIGIWIKRRREKLIFAPALCVDAAVHLVLPTVLLLAFLKLVPIFLFKRFVPDVYFIVIAVIFSLYFGALVKLCVGVYIAIRGNTKGTDEKNAEKQSQEGTGLTKEEKINHERENLQSGQQQKGEKGHWGTEEKKTEKGEEKLKEKGKPEKEEKPEEKKKQESEELKEEENSGSSSGEKEKQNPKAEKKDNGEKTEKSKKGGAEQEEKNNGSKEGREQEETENDRTEDAGLEKVAKNSNGTEKTEDGKKEREALENEKIVDSEVKETKEETLGKKEESRKGSCGAETEEGKEVEQEEGDRKESGIGETKRAKEPEQGRTEKRTEGTEKRKGKAGRQDKRKKTVAKEKRRREKMRVAARRKSQKEQAAKAMAEKSQKEQAITAVREKRQREQITTAEKNQRGLKQEAETKKGQSRQRKSALKEKSRREKKRVLIKRKKQAKPKSGRK